MLNRILLVTAATLLLTSGARAQLPNANGTMTAPMLPGNGQMIPGNWPMIPIKSTPAGCSNALDFSSACNSQYLGAM